MIFMKYFILSMLHQLNKRQKADDKFLCLQNLKKISPKPSHPENLKTRVQNSVGLDEVAHYVPPHQDLRCLQIQLLIFISGA